MAAASVRLRPHGADDLALQLRLLGDPATMAHLGGPETPAQIERRHARSLAMTDPRVEAMLVVETDPDGTAVGSTGYWEREWRGSTAWETGWFVLPEFRGRGVASAAVREVLARLRDLDPSRAVHAFPSVDNDASNAICARTGFALLGPVEFEYPKGSWMRCNDWRAGPV